MSYSPGFTTQVLELNSVVLGLGRTGRPGAENRVQEHIGLNSDKGTMWGKVILGVSGAWETHKEKMNLAPTPPRVQNRCTMITDLREKGQTYSFFENTASRIPSIPLHELG